ncbi:MAG: AmmeMemoRadiSam system protein A [Micromonosporaceae bacterium]|nr:AmmeMemoRadiSam system protein A [Micromonosporaceae bacterium]
MLAMVAVGTIRSRLSGEGSVAVDVPAEETALHDPGASFVTLERQGKLRGCVGSLQAARPLYLDVVRNARRAMIDPRLPPVDRDDWPELDVKVSVLSAPTAIEFSGREALLAALQPGVDGLLLTDGERRATFLPTVWQRLTEPADFLGALLAKGGWPDGVWPANLIAHRYAAHEFHDAAPRNPLSEPSSA